jgi:hypothetical protein
VGSIRQRLSDRLLEVGAETAFDGEDLHRQIEADGRFAAMSAQDRQALDQHRAIVSFVGHVAVRLGLRLMPRSRASVEVPSRR